eukprot:TRINITY_DN25734_c0_g1_i1.p1 TRINITY_DN25734_c0_g1~~TRINITY_DN25734_c0_g1_i1.p1  ORF type:complete len:182 (+),score=15.71 TRINITY_DN25734_c0_g1_i1:89-634(+)
MAHLLPTPTSTKSYINLFRYLKTGVTYSKYIFNWIFGKGVLPAVKVTATIFMSPAAIIIPKSPTGDVVVTIARTIGVCIIAYMYYRYKTQQQQAGILQPRRSEVDQQTHMMITKKAMKIYHNTVRKEYEALVTEKQSIDEETMQRFAIRAAKSSCEIYLKENDYTDVEATEFVEHLQTKFP